MRQKTVLNPQAKRCEFKTHKGLECFGQFHIEDYRSVNAVDTFGSWPVLDLLPTVQQAQLAVFTNEMESR